MFRLLVMFAVVALVLLGTTTAFAGRATLSPTSGAIKVNAAQVKRIQPATCGKTGRTWLPGTLTRGRFIAHLKRAANLARMAAAAKGTARTKLLRQAAAARKLHVVQRKLCMLPDGARKLTRANMKTVASMGETIQCGRVRGWYPGMLTRGYFTAYTTLARRATIESKFVKGAARIKLLRQAASYRLRSQRHTRACTRAGGDNGGGTTPTPQVPATPTPLRFDLSGAIGLGVAPTSSSRAKNRARSAPRAAAAPPSSNLDVIAADGTLREAVSSGTAVVSRTLISPTGETFLLFQNRVNLDDTAAGWSATGCLLARVGSDGVPTCVDNTLMSINWSVGINGTHPGVQFDAAGGVYYSGSSGMSTVLRRSSGGTITDLISDNVFLSGFFVAPDGSVFVIGMTNSTGTRWYRRINTAGGLANLLGGEVEWVSGFPDGNVYAASIMTTPGVHRYLTATSMMDPTIWIGDATATFDATACGSTECYRLRAPMVRTTGNEVFGVNNNKRVVKLYPALEQLTSTVTTATLVAAAGNRLAIAGQNASGQAVLQLRDTAAPYTEQELIGPAGEVEIYHLAYSARRNVLMFDGLRFADNKVVLGEVDLATNAVRFTSELGTKWADLQLFG